MLNISEIQKNYQRYDDVKIRRLAESESRGLRKEVVAVLIEEIKQRGFELTLIDWIHAERRLLSDVEMKALKSKIKNLVCPICKRNKNLKAYQFETKTGIVVNSYSTEYKLIACQHCGNRKRNRSTIHSILLGWISPVSFIAYPLLLANKINIHINEDKLSDKLIEDFIKGNIGIITIENESTEILRKLILDYNSLEVSSMNH